MSIDIFLSDALGSRTANHSIAERDQRTHNLRAKISFITVSYKMPSIRQDENVDEKPNKFQYSNYGNTVLVI